MKHAALASVPKHIEHFSKFSPSPLSMKQFLDFGEYRASFAVNGGPVCGDRGVCERSDKHASVS